jgi:hypothetical protein
MLLGGLWEERRVMPKAAMMRRERGVTRAQANEGAEGTLDCEEEEFDSAHDSRAFPVAPVNTKRAVVRAMRMPVRVSMRRRGRAVRGSMRGWRRRTLGQLVKELKELFLGLNLLIVQLQTDILKRLDSLPQIREVDLRRLGGWEVSSNEALNAGEVRVELESVSSGIEREYEGVCQTQGEEAEMLGNSDLIVGVRIA